MKPNKFMLLLASSAMMLAFSSCENKTEPEPEPEPEPELSSDAYITAFTVTSGDVTIEGTIYEEDQVIELVYMADQLPSLATATATVSVSEGATISPDPSEVRDYTAAEPVTYTVTAEDGETTRTYSIEPVEGETIVRCEPVWDKTFGDLGLGSYLFGDCGVAFSGLDIVTFDGQVFDLDGNKIGDLNMTGLPNTQIVCMSNDNYGVLAASVGVTVDGGVPENGDAIHHGCIYAWLDGWENAPVELYRNDEGNVTRYFSLSGDVMNGDFILTAITDGRAASNQIHHLFYGSNAEFPGSWAQFTVSYPTNDGNWSQIISAATGGDINSVMFFVGDSRGDNQGFAVYARQGYQGADTALYGTLADDGIVAETEYGGSNQYGNYSTGNVRGFMYNGEPYVVASTSGWAASYVCIQPADPSADYLLRSAMYNVATPFPSSAYVYDPETDTGHVIYMAANTEIVRFDITRDLI